MTQDHILKQVILRLDRRAYRVFEPAQIYKKEPTKKTPLESTPSGDDVKVLSIPSNLVGRVIGKGRRTLSDIERQTKTKIHIPRNTGEENQSLSKYILYNSYLLAMFLNEKYVSHPRLSSSS
jgi:predicted PilT family ATPase